ncbi:MAG: hypothetical protein Q7T73_07310 [Beijerinckiaceae bacterium]|nr:hypothetical protein [Beijerinckiaceae bacterium]
MPDRARVSRLRHARMAGGHRPKLDRDPVHPLLAHVSPRRLLVRLQSSDSRKATSRKSFVAIVTIKSLEGSKALAPKVFL